MTHDTVPAYGLWGLVVINTAVFVIFDFSFTKPATPSAHSRPSSSRCLPRCTAFR